MYNIWWSHKTETFYALLALCEGNPPITGGFSSQRPVPRSFDVFFDLHRNKLLSKQSGRPRAYYDVIIMKNSFDWLCVCVFVCIQLENVKIISTEKWSTGAPVKNKALFETWKWDK